MLAFCRLSGRCSGEGGERGGGKLGRLELGRSVSNPPLLWNWIASFSISVEACRSLLCHLHFCHHIKMQSGKRLADIAAPAVEAAVVEQPQVKKESAKQRARIEQGLAEVRVESIRVDGLVSDSLENLVGYSGRRQHRASSCRRVAVEHTRESGSLSSRARCWALSSSESSTRTRGGCSATYCTRCSLAA